MAVKNYYDDHSKVLDILTARYRSLYPDDPVIEFKSLENIEGVTYYVAEKQAE